MQPYELESDIFPGALRSRSLDDQFAVLDLDGVREAVAFTIGEIQELQPVQTRFD